MALTRSPNAVWRGDPPTALHEPKPAEIVTLMQELIGGVFSSETELSADTMLAYSGGAGKWAVAAGDIITAGGVRYEVLDSSSTDNTVTTSGGVKLRRLWSEGEALEETTLLIPTDFPDLPTAFEFLRQTRVASGDLVELRFESGYEIAAGVAFEHDDFSQVRITSTDATVAVAAGFVGVSVSSDPFEADSLFVASNSRAPRLECLIDMGDTGGCGYVLKEKSSGYVGSACGVINAGAFGLYLSKGSSCVAAGCNFSGAAWGNRVTTASFLEAPSSNWSGAKNATYSGSNTAANMDVSRGSVVYITGSVGSESDLTNGAGRGLAVRRSFCSATSVDCSGSGLEGVNASHGSVVAFNGSIASNCGTHGIFASGSVTIDAGDGVVATGNATYNLFANGGGKISARDATLTGGGVNGVRAAQGSQVNISGANCRRNGTSDQATDIVCGEGSIIHAIGALGGTNTAPLELSTNGLIFKAV